MYIVCFCDEQPTICIYNIWNQKYWSYLTFYHKFYYYYFSPNDLAHVPQYEDSKERKLPW